MVLPAETGVCQRRFTPAEQFQLIGDNLHKHPVSHAGMTYQRFDRRDLQRDSVNEGKISNNT